MNAFDKSIMFGMANIEMELQSGEKLYFRGKATDDGKDFLQTEGGVFTVEPKMKPIEFEDTGESTLDDRVTGWEAKLKLTVSQESLELIQLSMAGAHAIKDSEGSTLVGITDGPLGSSNRDRAIKMVIHPRDLDPSDKSKDIVIYKAASTSGFERAYKNEQGKFDLEFNVYPRDNFDMSKPGNFFHIGPTDPNATVI
ncbi:hypothetical protein [Macrococcus armenti]|uniref:Phage tail protein n=1 Tax=Macrococcus armenti TaxID=2875764 RepID=A0ABY3ZX74_9STAP|nr:hypothetical protein [Macrococcus armenti]UOB21515.1 hypothetical protein MRZ06_05375 [Macrococcus armenti]